MKKSQAQIVATIGPASSSPEILASLIEHQMDVVRLNFSWGTYEEHAEYIRRVRVAAKEAGRHIPIIQDLSGPRIQEGKGHEFDESVEEIITEKDLKDLAFGLKESVDYVAMSYVGEAADVEKLRQAMKDMGRVVPIIAKVERKKALDNLDGIVKAADAVMVARGDLGDSIPPEQVPFAQHFIIDKAKAAKKPVITATQMLLSMVQNSKPTRAEVSDVAHTILDGSDAVMLSEETAIGKYPVEAVIMMEKIIQEAEKYYPDHAERHLF